MAIYRANSLSLTKVPKGNPYHSGTSGEMAIYRVNSLSLTKVPKGNPYHSGISGEMAIYRANSLSLTKAGVKMADPVVDVFNGQEVEVWPRITWKPKWALTYGDVKKKVREGCYVSQRSTMILNGQNIFLDGLSLDGTIVINAISGTEVNKGWTLKHIDYKNSSFLEEMRIRGFVIDKVEQLEMNYSEPGKFSLGS